MGHGHDPGRADCRLELAPRTARLEQWTKVATSACDSILVKHVSGGTSTIGFKSYDQGREKWQSETLDWAWLDEEPPADIYIEALTRTNATGGMLWMTFTPMLGMSDVVHMYIDECGLS